MRIVLASDLVRGASTTTIHGTWCDQPRPGNVPVRGTAASERTPARLSDAAVPPVCVVWAPPGLPHTLSEADRPVLIQIRHRKSEVVPVPRLGQKPRPIID